jgi:hypothetical protein
MNLTASTKGASILVSRGLLSELLSLRVRGVTTLLSFLGLPAAQGYQESSQGFGIVSVERRMEPGEGELPLKYRNSAKLLTH